MILDMVKTIIGELPIEYEFIYYIISCGASIALLALPLSPFLVLFRNFGRSRR